MWQHVLISKEIHPRDTLGVLLGIHGNSNNNNNNNNNNNIQIVVVVVAVVVVIIVVVIIIIIIIAIIIIIVILIMAFKGAIRDFFTISSLRREPSPTRTLKWPGRNRVQITCNALSAYHVQHVVLRATWYKGTAQLLSLTELKSH